MHFAVAGRRHELAFNRVRDYAEIPSGIQADLRVSKVRPRVVPVPYGSRPSICPVRAWQAWKEAAGLTDPDGYAWRRLHNRWHTVLEGGLQPTTIGDVVTRAGERAGIEIRFTGHSPRRGLATSSRLKGHDQIVIAKQGGWAPHSTRRPPTSRTTAPSAPAPATPPTGTPGSGSAPTPTCPRLPSAPAPSWRSWNGAGTSPPGPRSPARGREGQLVPSQI
ncbi:hypothetical protein [Streptomyces sp. NPDC003996]